MDPNGLPAERERLGRRDDEVGPPLEVDGEVPGHPPLLLPGEDAVQVLVVVGAPLLAAPAAWVAGLALAPAGARRACAGAGGAGSVWTGQWWAALGSVLGQAIALQLPLAGLVAVPAVVVALSGAGYLRTAAPTREAAASPRPQVPEPDEVGPRR